MNWSSRWSQKIWTLLPNRKFTVKRLVEGLIFLWLISLASFIIVQIAPGDSTLSLLRIDSVAVTTEQVAELKQQMGFSDPLYIKYFRYMNNLVHFDLGKSVMTGNSVVFELQNAFPTTLLLTGSAMFLAFLLVMILGALSAKYVDSWLDRFSTLICLIGVSIPTFWLGLLLIDLFSVKLNVLPSIGVAGGKGFIIPSFLLALSIAPTFIRVFRNSLLESSQQDFIRAARSRGLLERTIFFKHILKGSLIPVLTILGASIGGLLSGSVIIEVIFGLPGIGKLVVEAVTRRDYDVVQGVVLFVGILVFVINFLVDLSYKYLNPAIELKEAEYK